jgi:hypothetical protein
MEVDIERPRPGLLMLHYRVTGAVDGLRLAPLAAAVRADELWRHTCFEAFVRMPPSSEYWEFNFAPSRQWAAYRFDAYRAGMRPAEDIRAPHIEARLDPEHYALQVRLEFDQWPQTSQAAIWTVALTAVLEEADGQKSYWALAHPPGHADFHHAHGFTLQLPIEAP